MRSAARFGSSTRHLGLSLAIGSLLVGSTVTANRGYTNKLQVGVGVVNATNVSFAPEFQELQLKPEKGKP